MAITLKVDGLVEGTVGERTVEELVQVFEQCLNLALVKEQGYGGAWRQQGWMGNLARVMSKVARLKSLCWTDSQMNTADESIDDTLSDLVNLAAFAAINRRRGNKWGSP